MRNTKGHVTRGNFSCNLSRNNDDCKMLQLAEGVSRVRNIFFATCNARAGNYLQLFLRQLEISSEQKTGLDCLIFTKLRCRFRWTCHTQQLVTQRCGKLRMFLLFLQLATQRYVAVAGGVKSEIFLATFLATFVGRQVARKIASCNKVT